MKRTLCVPLAVVIATCLLPAQGGGDPPAATEWISFSDYSERTSRAVFTACDGNADDRLSVLEHAPVGLHRPHSLRFDSEGLWPGRRIAGHG